MKKLKESRGLLVLFFGDAEGISGAPSVTFVKKLKESRETKD